jgi:hypothetical protein
LFLRHAEPLPKRAIQIHNQDTEKTGGKQLSRKGITSAEIMSQGNSLDKLSRSVKPASWGKS